MMASAGLRLYTLCSTQPARHDVSHAPLPRAAGGPRGQAQTQTRTVPLEQIITDIAHMGFERHQVMAVVNQLQQAGQSVDLNIILDRLTNGRY